jgi:DHA2 family multidrug resistance protein
MMIAGRLMGKVDARLLIFTGTALMGLSLWQMSGFTLVMGSGPIIVSGIVQGLGLGLIFVPLQSLAFGSLPPQYRTTAAALLNLSRNIGGSLGISLVTALLARNLQVSHADIAAHITPYTLAVAGSWFAQAIGAAGDTVAAMLDLEVNRQALMIAYLDDFHIMMLVTLAALPLVLLLRKAQPSAGPPPVMAD